MTPGVEERILGRKKPAPPYPSTALTLTSCVALGKSPLTSFPTSCSSPKECALERVMGDPSHAPDIFSCLVHWWLTVQRRWNRC